ncbi:hypothetical protein CAPTEDRAFT_161103 [Capitella teleta]|uniref:ACB domain-containing protein n=1 Tax=Capitella teleta TaxID=283909 RepID=R7U4U6_CAPTE|nr:hypothetical protein CAPTEDRAFT_161103 [Capitella teleta]|eukprot:ELU00959.1 hypothetical protein CAPTEDRAFT_161103 [Capitella teleta]
MATNKEKFDLAVDIVATLPKDGPIKPSNDLKLKFYGFYKQATIGKCNAPQPWAVDMINRSKWNAWNDLDDMSADEAMKKYAEAFYQSIIDNADDGADAELKAKLEKFRAMMK